MSRGGVENRARRRETERRKEGGTGGERQRQTRREGGRKKKKETGKEAGWEGERGQKRVTENVNREEKKPSTPEHISVTA